MRIKLLIACLGLSALGQTFAIDLPEKVEIGSFFYQESLDPITDADSSYIYTKGTADEYDNSTLTWSCEVDGLNVNINTRYNLGKGAKAIYRFDKSKASKLEAWIDNTKNTGIYATDKQIPILTKAALKSKTMVVRIMAEDQTKYVVQYDLTGIEDALTNLPCASEYFDN